MCNIYRKTNENKWLNICHTIDFLPFSLYTSTCKNTLLEEKKSNVQ